MAANAAASFAYFLAAETDYVMPTDDKDVRDTLDSFGVVFNKRKGDANVAVRADLLASLALLCTHHHNLDPLVKVLTAAQQQTLATALGLDFQAHGTDAEWQTLLGRRIVSRQIPGSTPKKCKPSGSDSSAAAGSGSEADASSPGSAMVELMPDVLGSGPAFDTLVAAACARQWLPTAALEDVIPATYLPRLFRASHWQDKQRVAYDKMIQKQPALLPALFRREDPTHVAFPHSLKFSFSPDDGP
jgi:hypothetical protein